jgi:hypothetical protein
MGFVCARACAVIIIIQICAVKVKSLGSPLPQALIISILLESVKLSDNKKVIKVSIITNKKASG